MLMVFNNNGNSNTINYLTEARSTRIKKVVFIFEDYKMFPRWQRMLRDRTRWKGIGEIGRASCRERV